MCGIAGIAQPGGGNPDPVALTRMAGALRHRGPDGYGYFCDPGIALAHCRLSIIDLVRGDQPLAGCGERRWITFNGEIYNYRELRRDLEPLGHRFRTDADTEVLVHALEAWGVEALPRLNGQFAFGCWDRSDRSLLLVRDRFGVRPLYYVQMGSGILAFGSEAKALFAAGWATPSPDPAGLDEVALLWSARAPRTPFLGVRQLPPGSWLRWHDGVVDTGRWFAPRYVAGPRDDRDATEELDALLRSAVALRMRADVPVGAYLSGGLDSAITCTLAAGETPHALRTFSVGFADPALDESPHQRAVAAAIGSRHVAGPIGAHDIAAVFPDVIRHAETPLLRTAAAPMFLLSRLAREQGITVVLTGEGSDEVFLGYDLFKEVEVRRFCLRQPASRIRPRLFDRLYPWMGAQGGELWQRFFLQDADPADPLFSHLPRITHGRFLQEFYGPALRDTRRVDVVDEWRRSVPDEFHQWSSVDRAAWLELTSLLDGYLLSSQGDRMAMAHGVEGRYPFLDHRLFAFAAHLPERRKLRGLEEKAILRDWARGIIPEVVRRRHKQPYRAPDSPAFFGPGAPAWVEAVLDETAVRRSGLFDPRAVAGLVRRCRAGRAAGTRENQALVGVLSAQLWHQMFMEERPQAAELPFEGARVLAGEGLPASLEG